MKTEKIIFYVSLFTVIFSLDRLTKHLVLYQMPRFIVNQFLSIDLVINRGISWGLFHSQQSGTFWALNVVIACIITTLLMYMITEYKSGRPILGETMVLAGALSNYCDRIWYHGVVDFIAFSFGTYGFPVFNVADIFIVCGVGLILLGHYLDI